MQFSQEGYESYYTCPEQFRTTAHKAEIASTRLSRAGQNFWGSYRTFDALGKVSYN